MGCLAGSHFAPEKVTSVGAFDSLIARYCHRHEQSKRRAPRILCDKVVSVITGRHLACQSGEIKQSISEDPRLQAWRVLL